jgi:MFS family permease
VTLPLRKNRDFVLLQVGQTLSTIGSESTGIAYPLLVLAITHSPAKAGLVGFARALPWPLFGFVAGVIADRSRRKLIMITTDLVRICTVTSVVVAIVLGSLSFAQIVVVAFVEGTMFVFFNIAEFGALRAVVPPHQLPVAVAAEQARYSTVSLVAPPLGGALYGIARALPWIVNAAAIVCSLGSLVAIRTRFEQERTRGAARSLRAELAEGFRWLWGHSFFRACALLFTGVNIVYEGLFLVLVVVGKEQGLSSGEIGALIAVFGVCSLIGSALAPRVQRRLSMATIVITSFWLQLGIAAFIVVPSVYVLLVGWIPAALFLPTSNAAVIGYRVAVVPERLTSRVNGVARTIALSGLPLGPLAAGLLLASISSAATVAVFSAFLVALAVLGTANRAIRDAPSLADLDALPAGGV